MTPDMRPVRLEDLAIGAAHFPPIIRTCESCDGAGKIILGQHPDLPIDEVHECGECQNGIILREMDPREEHWYLMHLILGLHKRTGLEK